MEQKKVDDQQEWLKRTISETKCTRHFEGNAHTLDSPITPLPDEESAPASKGRRLVHDSW